MERYALGMFRLQAGGLLIDGTATLTGTNVYENRADRVCSPSEPSQTFSPRTTLQTMSTRVTCRAPLN